MPAPIWVVWLLLTVLTLDVVSTSFFHIERHYRHPNGLVPSFASIADFRDGTADLLVMLVVRLSLVAVGCFYVTNYIRKRQRLFESSVKSQSQPTDAPDGPDTELEPLTRRQAVALPVVNDAKSDDFVVERARAQLRRGHSRIMIAWLTLCFAAFTACNVVAAMKSLYFNFGTDALGCKLSITAVVIWTDLEVFTLQLFMRKSTADDDAYLPDLHPHHLIFCLNVIATKCDVCRARIQNEGFQCTQCDFDACAECFKKKTRAHGENQIQRSEKGFKEEGDGELSAFSYMLRSLQLLRPFAFQAVIVLVCLATTQCIRIFLPGLQGKIIDSVISKDQATFWKYLKWYAGSGGAVLIVGSIRSFCILLVMRNVTNSIRTRLFASLIRRDVAFFDGATVGALTSRMSQDTNATVSPLQTLINSVLADFILLVGGLFMCFVVCWRLAMVSLTVVGPIIFITGVYARWSKKINRRVWDSLAEANSIATEAFSNIRTVRAFSTELFEQSRFNKMMHEALSKTLVDAIATAGTFFMTNMLDFSAMTLILGFGGRIALGANSDLTVGQLVTFQLYANMMNNAYQGLNNVINQFTRAAGAAERVLSLLDSQPDIDPEHGACFDEATFRGDIELRGVKFVYQMRPQQMILNDVSAHFAAGTMTAIVGRSGSGKSTLIHLLLRYYDAAHGSILYDGRDVKELSLAWLHHRTAVVSQDTQLFATTVLENITYGLEDVKMEDVHNAARLANAHEFIQGFPDGYMTKVGERGVRLSGGQKQRIAIARALLRAPRILFLDEATSALDSESEAVVQEAIDKLVMDLHERKCTIVVVAHRLSTVVHAENILVLDEGRVAEQGTHSELLRLNGVYAKLVSRQLQAASGCDFFTSPLSTQASSPSVSKATPV